MLSKYLNKKVEISEKIFDYSSTLGALNGGNRNKIIGVVTDIDDNFIELDNNTLIAIKYIYRIKLV